MNEKSHDNESTDPARWYSAAPLSGFELQRLRSRMEDIDRIAPLIDSYDRAATVGKFITIIGGSVIGFGVGVLGVLVALKELAWWPFHHG